MNETEKKARIKELQLQLDKMCCFFRVFKDPKPAPKRKIKQMYIGPDKCSGIVKSSKPYFI